MSKADLDRGVQTALKKSEELGHKEMKIQFGDGETFASYICNTCGLGFTVTTKEHAHGELIAGYALLETRQCKDPSKAIVDETKRAAILLQQASNAFDFPEDICSVVRDTYTKALVPFIASGPHPNNKDTREKLKMILMAATHRLAHAGRLSRDAFRKVSFKNVSTELDVQMGVLRIVPTIDGKEVDMDTFTRRMKAGGMRT